MTDIVTHISNENSESGTLRKLRSVCGLLDRLTDRRLDRDGRRSVERFLQARQFREDHQRMVDGLIR